jgi:endoglucanase
MSRFGLVAFVSLVLALSGCAGSAPRGTTSPSAAPAPAVEAWANADPKLARGMNIGNALESPREGEWGNTVTEEHFAAFQATGFDHVRLPIRFDAHASDDPPYTIAPKFLERIDWAIDRATAHHLAIVLDMHHFNELHRSPEKHADQFVELWKQIASRYRDRPRNVVFELLNEPHDKLTSDVYNPILARALAAVRAIDAKRLVIVDCVFWANADKLDELALTNADPNLIVSFHMYQPILFTHQGLTAFMPAEYGTKGIVFPGPPKAPVDPVAGARAVPWVSTWFDDYNHKGAAENPSGPKTIDEQFHYATAYTARTKLPLYMGEFGVGDAADPDSRARWLRTVRERAEHEHIGWAYWDDNGRFKMFDVSTNTWTPYLKDALLQ